MWWRDRAAEPPGLNGVDTTHQELTIDPGPLAAVQPPHVEAAYRLRNRGRPANSTWSSSPA